MNELIFLIYFTSFRLRMQCVIKNQEEGYMIRHEVAIGCQNKHEGKGFNLIGSDSGDMI